MLFSSALKSTTKIYEGVRQMQWNTRSTYVPCLNIDIHRFRTYSICIAMIVNECNYKCLYLSNNIVNTLLLYALSWYETRQIIVIYECGD